MRRFVVWNAAIVLAIGVVLAARLPAWAFIERLTHLKDVIADSDFIAVAKVESIDAEKPSMLLAIDKDLKGKAKFRKMAINLNGDKEKHTPELLKRIANDLPIIVFITELDEKKLVLGYTNGTWFQIIGEADGDKIRWAFTHCEIYLRRTFKGTTAEMQKTVEEVIAGKAKAPPADAKEKPGFGPEIEQKKLEGSPFNGGGMLIGIVALPFAAPFLALLNILFPGLLAVQWRQYKIAIMTLLTITTVMCGFMVARWVYGWLDKTQPAWLGLDAEYVALAVVSAVGLVAALIGYMASDREHKQLAAQPPSRVEYWLFGVLFTFGIAWGVVVLWLGQVQDIFDQMFLFTVASGFGLLHLIYRAVTQSQPPRMRWVPTQSAFLCIFAAASFGLAYYYFVPTGPANVVAGEVRTDWQSYRGGADRLGTLDPDDPGPKKPKVLWTFDAGANEKGKAYLHSAPAVIDGQIYFGSMHTVANEAYGKMHCLNVEDGRELSGTKLKAGEFLWKYPAKFSLKPVYSAPTLVKGKLYFGEGYHQDTACRLFCMDPATGKLLWAKRTKSHVESSPWVDGNLVVFGAGDDGIIAVDAKDLEEGEDKIPSPKTLWSIGKIHVDISPLVIGLPDKDDPKKSAGKRVFGGSVLGDIYKDFCVVAWDVEKEKLLWRLDTELPACSSPSFANGRVFFGFGKGKINEQVENPAGELLCVDAFADKCKRLWNYPTRSSIFAAPALRGDHVFFCEYVGVAYCLKQEDGTAVWKRDLKRPVVASSIVAGGKMYVITKDGVLHCLDTKNKGEDVWPPLDLGKYVEDDYGVLCSPMLYKGRIYVGIGPKMLCIGDE